jgi:hypothetical protein
MKSAAVFTAKIAACLVALGCTTSCAMYRQRIEEAKQDTHGQIGDACHTDDDCWSMWCVNRRCQRREP